MTCARLAEKAVALLCCEKLHRIGKNITMSCRELQKLWKLLQVSLSSSHLQVSWMIT